MKNNNFILEPEGSESSFLNTDKAKNYGNRKKDSGVFNPMADTIVIHYTGGTTLAGAQNVLYDDEQQKVSAHFIIDNDTDATIHQLMPLNKIAWHAGISKLGDRKNLNRFSLGIEIVNPGYLKKDGSGRFLTAFNRDIDSKEAVEAKHPNESFTRYWHRYTEKQIEHTLKLCLELKKLFVDIKYIVGHDEISPGRKQDPGPLFPIDKFRDYVFQQGFEEKDQLILSKPKTGHVKASLLNIRERGDSQATKVARPLKEGTKVEILDERDGWYKVKTEISGWVSKDFIEL